MPMPARLAILVDDNGRVNLNFLADDPAGRGRLVAMFWRIESALGEFEQEVKLRLAEAPLGEPREMGEHLDALRARQRRAGQRAYERHLAGRPPLRSVPDPPLPDPADVSAFDEVDGKAPPASDRP
jgi:hypothetical protein